MISVNVNKKVSFYLHHESERPSNSEHRGGNICNICKRFTAAAVSEAAISPAALNHLFIFTCGSSAYRERPSESERSSHRETFFYRVHGPVLPRDASLCRAGRRDGVSSIYPIVGNQTCSLCF